VLARLFADVVSAAFGVTPSAVLGVAVVVGAGLDRWASAGFAGDDAGSDGDWKTAPFDAGDAAATSGTGDVGGKFVDEGFCSCGGAAEFRASATPTGGEAGLDGGTAGITGDPFALDDGGSA